MVYREAHRRKQYFMQELTIKLTRNKERHLTKDRKFKLKEKITGKTIDQLQVLLQGKEEKMIQSGLFHEV